MAVESFTLEFQDQVPLTDRAGAELRAEAGQKEGVTKERVRQIEGHAMRELRRLRHTLGLRSYLT